jgi:hypothetical protein
MRKVYNLCKVKTVMTTVLTVMCDMDPHMSSWDTGWFGWILELAGNLLGLFDVIDVPWSSWSWRFT